MIHDETHLQAFAALQDLRVASEAAERPMPGLSASRIIAHARRNNSTADLQVERALRASPAARQLYAVALGRIVRASSLSVAAAADQVTERRVGTWRLEIVQETDGMAWLVIHALDQGPVVTMIELRRPDGSGRRLHLGTPIDQVFQLPLDPEFAELAGLIAWLQDPATEIYLI